MKDPKEVTKHRLKDPKEVIKHSAAIQIANDITLLQRKAWNVLFANAYDQLPTQQEHTVNVSELMSVLEYTSANQEHLKSSLKDLVTTGVEWNVLQKDKVIEWGVTALLAQAKIEGGVCVYAYSPELRRRLHNPAMYARISLEMQNKFGSKHALALWELFQDYFDESRQFGETPWISIERYRQLMGVSNQRHKPFKMLNQRVIKEPVKQIEEVTDYVIEVAYRRNGRKVVAVKFKIRYVLKVVQDGQEPSVSFIDTQGLPELVAQLVKAGVHVNKAKRIWSQGYNGVKAEARPRGVEFADYVRQKLELLAVESAKGKVEDQAAWLVAAIAENYDVATVKKGAEAKAAQERRKRRAELSKERERIQKDYERECDAIFEAIITENPAALKEAMDEAFAEMSFLKEFYDADKTVLENYRHHPMLVGGVRPKLRQRYPKRFEAVDETYKQRIEVTREEEGEERQEDLRT